MVALFYYHLRALLRQLNWVETFCHRQFLSSLTNKVELLARLNWLIFFSLAYFTPSYALSFGEFVLKKIWTEGFLSQQKHEQCTLSFFSTGLLFFPSKRHSTLAGFKPTAFSSSGSCDVTCATLPRGKQIDCFHCGLSWTQRLYPTCWPDQGYSCFYYISWVHQGSML
jgi:hypothetical protein